VSLVEFESIAYQQSSQVATTDEIKWKSLKIGIRKLERDTGVSHHTIEKT